MSQNKLAKFVGCSQPGICKMLKGNFLSLKNLEKLENIGLINKRKLLYEIDSIGVSNTRITSRVCIEFLKNIIFQK